MMKDMADLGVPKEKHKTMFKHLNMHVRGREHDSCLGPPNATAACKQLPAIKAASRA
jgi:hypothetical protein